MKRESPCWWFTRVMWPLVGGAWGAWVGFQGVFQHYVPDMNVDTAAPVFVWGFFVFFAGVGLFTGAASAIVIGGSFEWLLRRIGIGFIAAISVATLVNVLALWQITDFLQTKYPGLRAERAEKPHRGKTTGAITPAEKGSHQKPCLAPPPTDTRERAGWDAECR
jgi:hypothetical protein